MVSPSRVVALLAHDLGLDSDLSGATREEHKLASTFAFLLKQAALDGLVYGEEEELVPLDQQDQDHSDPDWNEADFDLVNDLPPPDRMRFHFSRGCATLESIVVAARFYRSTTTKAHRSLEVMKQHHRFIGNDYDLRKMEQFAKEADESSNRRAGRIIALQCISDDLYKEAIKAMEDGFSLHDVDLQVMAININREKNYLANFDASQSWVTRFKRKTRLGSRRTTKFVSKKNHVDDARIKKEAADFVAGIKEEMKTRPVDQICNADQSGFLKELHSKRSLAPIGEKIVVRVVQSAASLTHSYTVMPLVFADGSMGDFLFVICAGTSHIMTKNHMKEWIAKCIFTSLFASNDLCILLDSWTSFRDKNAIDSSFPPGKTFHTRQIAAGATGICQPLDVYFFRLFKGLVRRIQSHAFKHAPNFMVYQRDNILKLISLSFKIMRAPLFKPMIIPRPVPLLVVSR